MQRVDKTIYKEIPENVQESGETFQKPDYIGQSSNKCKKMYINDESCFVFLFENNSSVEYHQRLKHPELTRRVMIDLVPPISTHFHENTLFMLHPDRKISIIQFLKQGSNKDYVNPAPLNFFPSPDFITAKYLVGWNEYIAVFNYSKMMVIDRFNTSKSFTSFPLTCSIIKQCDNEYSFGFQNQVVIINNEINNILYQQYDVSNGVLVKQGNVPQAYKETKYVCVAHNDRDVAVAYEHAVYIFSLGGELKNNTPIAIPRAILQYTDAPISKIYLDNSFLVIGDIVGGASVYTATGTFLTKIAPEDDIKTEKKVAQNKRRVTAITRFNLFVVIGLADGKAKFFTWDYRYSGIEKKECGGKIIRIYPHPELNKVCFITENGSERRIVGLTYWSPIEKSFTFISPYLAHSPELRYVSYIKPFVDQLRVFVSCDYPNESVGFKRTKPRLRGIYNFVKFLEQADNVHRLPFPVNLVWQLTVAMQKYCELQDAILSGKEKDNYFSVIRAENRVLAQISKICFVDTVSIPLKDQPQFPAHTYLNDFTHHFEKVLNAQMYKPIVSESDKSNYKNFLWKILKTLFDDYVDFADALENLDILMSTINRDNVYAFVGAIKIYGRYIQIMQDIKETAWSIAQVLGIRETDRWYYGGGLYMGKKMPEVCSDQPNIPEVEFPLKMN
ncbi:hypothetical protein EDI_009780 [Entamoeba dispar SAW760]|uniref:Uncharacterized protein n=1 Tax=Entamoeba dispar (strain ATCC PRA-260 / SAW760) TaxID=370354 RepID=B0EG88_ENTDS|nr:uncharacterized protein EDI_009780 [Entamoeba dispar SAW760]EDR26465.1 hypothetical protein EDI_009780 [Entamoeba dispar SAW760]|eukprot:EDR26465.1 hypothetical protein EDI_009780 [Entamoeba dispar SAW760]